MLDDFTHSAYVHGKYLITQRKGEVLHGGVFGGHV
jgi:hypothetical protein